MNRDLQAGHPMTLPERAIGLYRQHRALFWELVRFGTTGGLSVLGYAATLLLLVQAAGVDITVATVPSYLASMVFNYLAQKMWTFRSKATLTQSVPKYLVVHAVGMGINYGVVALMINTLGAPFLLAQAVAIGLIALWSYSAQKFWVFVA